MDDVTTIGRYWPTLANKREIEGGDRREMQCIARKRVDQSRASPVGADARTHPVVRPAGLRLNLVARLPAGLADRRAMQIIELRQAAPDHRPVDQCDRIGEREGQPPVVRRSLLE